MAYNPYYPYMSQMYQPPQNQQPQNNGGLVMVRSIDEVMKYPIAPGNSVTFKDETAPYLYTKTMGFSQFDHPVIEKYKIIKEDTAQDIQPHPDDNSLRNDVEKLKQEMKEIRDEFNSVISATKIKPDEGITR